MTRKRFFWSLLLAGVMSGAQAQQTAVKAVADGHYLGAKQQLERFLDEKDARAKGEGLGKSAPDLSSEDAEALMLVCDYVLNAQGTADKMGKWTTKHPLSQYAEVLRVFRRNLLVKEHRFAEALKSFFEDEAAGVSVETPLAYPLTGLSDEAYAYQEVLYRLAGEKLYDEGQYERAMTYLEAGEKTRTSQYKLGMCYYRNGMFEKAYNTFVESAGVDQDEMAQNAWLHAGIAVCR